MIPKLSETTKTGIFQGDIILRSALLAAIQDLRANPYLLKAVFADIPQDVLTSGVYGQAEARNAIKWFQRTNIPVLMDYRVDQHPGTALVISLVDSSEAEATIGDVHYIPSEDSNQEWPILVGPFDATYAPSTGVVTMPETDVVVVPGMLLLDSTGAKYEIAEVMSTSTFRIATGLVIVLRGAHIKGQEPSTITQLESVNFRETYRIGIVVTGEPHQLLWLHSIVTFMLLRYKQELLEKRGYEKTTIASSPVQRASDFGEVQGTWSRYITITGSTKSTWPKYTLEPIQSVTVTPQFTPSGRHAITWSPEVPEDALFDVIDGIGIDINDL